METTPTTLARKRNLDRTLSVEKRLISDLRRANLNFDLKIVTRSLFLLSPIYPEHYSLGVPDARNSGYHV